MKIGKLVKHHIEKVFKHCEAIDHEELERLQDKGYSKKTFNISFPFCSEVADILSEDEKRYWKKDIYPVRGKEFKVSSQWFAGSRTPFIKYIVDKKISSLDEIEQLTDIAPPAEKKSRTSTMKNKRYRGNAIGNAQNLLVRNVLSNLGEESFSEKDWAETKAYFDNKCAYCGFAYELVIEHAIPINRASLGEHRLGNLIPSCHSCNAKKHDKDYREFLDGQQNRIGKIEEYMASRDYVPLGDNKQVAKILAMAYQEMGAVSARYISILNEFLTISSSGGTK